MNIPTPARPAAIAAPRRWAVVLLLAAMCLGWPLPVLAQITPTLQSTANPNVQAVFSASTNLQTTIQNGGNVAGALSTYNSAVATAAVPPSTVSTAGTQSNSVTVGPNLAAVIFAAGSGTLLFNGFPATAVTVENSGGFFLGTGSTALPFTFSDNTAATFVIVPGVTVDASGGAVNNAGTATFTNSSFTSNIADGAATLVSGQSGRNLGGAIYNTGTVTIANSNFTSNSVVTGSEAVLGSTNLGGAIYNAGNATISNSTFMSNAATNNGNGGAIYNFGGALAVANSSFSGNTAGLGGAIASTDGGTLTIVNSSFRNNSNSAVFSGATAAIAGSTFTSNTGSFAGAILNQGTMAIDNSTFSGNITSSVGGAIQNGGALTISNSSFTGNMTTTSLGGAISSIGPLTISNSSFSSNTATGNGFGGAIDVEASTVTISNSTFTSNRASRGGAAIDILGGSTTIINSSFIDNTCSPCDIGAGAIWNAGSSTLNLDITAGQVSTFSGNTAAGEPNSINFAAGDLNVDVATGGLLDMRDPMSGNPQMVTKTGPGVSALGGDNTYTGPTVINGGVLEVNGTIENSPATVNGSGTLAGTGIVNPAVTINSGGTLSPGMPGAPGTPGTITVGPLTLNNGSILSYLLGTPNVVGGPNSLTNVNGALTVNGTDTVFATNTGTFGAGAYRLINYTAGEFFPNGAITVGTLPFGATGVIDATTVPGQVNLIVSAAPATTQFWDGANMVAGGIANGRGGNGTWNNTSTNWTTSTGSFNSSWQGNSAVFAGAPGTVTVADTIAYKSIQFSTGGYVLTASAGGTLVPTGVAPISVDGGLMATIGAPITGSGGLDTNDLGTLILTGANTYTGGTTISFGTLQLGNGGTTGSIVGNVTDNGTLAFDRSDVVTFPGIISGTGAVQQIGTGTTILTADSTYTGGTTISFGTLQLGNGGTTGSIVGDVANYGILAFDRSDVVTFPGVISGTGAVQQIGSGTTILTGDNTYIGGTTISAGTLQLGNGGTTGSIVGEVANNGILAFDRSDVVTFPGIISGTGAVQQIGTGTTILTADNTYTGVTTISAGTLQLGNGGASGSILGNVTDNGILAFDRSDVVTFPGIISGTGAVQQIGTGTTILTADNTYTGSTTITAGTLQLGNGGTSGSILGNVTDNGTLAFDRSDVVTFPGVISGTGAVQQIGSGTLVLSADNSYTGSTDVASGILDVTGSIASASLTTVASGATLTGTGTVGNAQINGGATLAPGNGTPGTFMTVAGNLAFQSGALYMVQVSPATASFTAVTGTASLNGTVDATFAPGSYVGKQYLILQSAGLGGTTFSGLTTVGLPAGFIASLSYSPDDAFLNLTAALGAGTALNVNQHNVATALNNFFNSGHALPPSFAGLFGLSGPALSNTLTQLSGEVATGAERSSFELTNQFLNLMLNPYVATSGGAPAQPVTPPPAVYKAPVFKAPVPTFEQRWTIWAAGFGGSGTANGDPVVGSNNVTTSTAARQSR